ncbi:MAG: PH domain-containing protein [Candidatus Woesearchaeota archaeon]
MTEETLQTYKPEFNVFVVYGLVVKTLFFLILITILIAISLMFIRALFPFIITLIPLLYLYIVVGTIIQYKKTYYEITPTKIIAYSGGIITNTQTEVLFKRIVTVSLVRPFVEYSLFKTGYVHIDSAGSGNSITCVSLLQPEQLYKDMRTYMKQSGFSLSRKKLLLREQPKTIGIALDLFRTVFFLAVAFIFIGGPTLILLILQSRLFFFLFLFVSTFVVLGFGIWFLLRYLDLKKRVYSIYEDLIEYNEGFLTKHDAFIPQESLTDAQQNQNFIERIVDIHTVIIRCEGSNNQILFTNIGNGKKLVRVVKSIIETGTTTKLQPEQTNIPEQQQASTTPQPKTAKTTTKPLLQLRMKLSRVLVVNAAKLLLLIPVIFFPILFPIIFILAFQIGADVLRYFSHKFHMYAQSFEVEVKLLNITRLNFTDAKIMSFRVNRSILDKIMNTCTLEFTSIGSSEKMKFEHIEYDLKIVDQIRERLAFTQERTTSVNENVTSPLSICVGNIPLLIGVLFLSLIAFILGVIIHALILIAGGVFLVLGVLYIIGDYLRYKDANCHLYETYLTYTYGFFRTQTIFAKFENIKNTTVKYYPLLSTGEIYYDVAGEFQETGQKVAQNNRIVCKYVKELPPKKTGEHYKANLKSALLSYAPSCLLIVPILFLPLFIRYTKIRQYFITDTSLIVRTGIFYKYFCTIDFEKINRVRLHQNFANKATQTGNIYVYTAGSSSYEIDISHVNEYQKIYAFLQSLE